MGETNGLDNHKLTTKCFWLLSLCEVLLASDIIRIDDARTTITKDTLKLVIIAPKEKRKGHMIERPCEINRHPYPSDTQKCQFPKRAQSVQPWPLPRVSDENIVSNSFCSNYNMLDTYYKLDRNTQPNMTKAVIPLEYLSMTTP
ncbi:hypothetical protein AYI69_g8961 [Smittium culicis]|uniref:Uncharacterized protein n=1 Tax=Smittium culicis TaxID=133412 RepID=A0A1R1XG05_9FUNG|nr:hypothetical protein AYI69_g8961 [Smittium culicis]